MGIMTKAEATALFILETGTDSIAAWAYLPYVEDPETCAKCQDRATHEHHTKPFITQDELRAAIDEKRRAQFEAQYDC